MRLPSVLFVVLNPSHIAVFVLLNVLLLSVAFLVTWPEQIGETDISQQVLNIFMCATFLPLGIQYYLMGILLAALTLHHLQCTK